MSGRFRLDPKAPAPVRALPPPPPAPAARAPEAPLPPPTAPVASPPAASRRGLMLGAIVVAVLLVGGGVAVYVATAQGYPEAYLLETREYPPGLSKATLSAEDRDDLGVRSNPGRIDDAKLDDYEGSDGPPEEGHALVLQDASGARVLVTALRYADEDEAIDFAKQARALCSFAGGAVLRDGDVLVGILPEGASRAQVRAIANALKEKTDDLVTVC